MRRLQGSPSLLFLTIALCTLTPKVSWAQLGDYQLMRSLSGDEGADPQSGLVRGADNRFYGTATVGGGPDGAGTIYRITTNGNFSVIHRFLTTSPGGGLYPVSLIRGRDKHLYGTAEYGGTVNGETVDAYGNPLGEGIIYRLNWNEAGQTYEGITVLHTFDCDNGQGGDPWGPLVEGPDGALYGVTAPSARPDPACTEPTAVYKIYKDGTGFAIVARFEYLLTGSSQFGPLVFGDDGSIFGTLIDSHDSDFKFGSVFRIAPGGDVTYPKIFNWADGAWPYSGLVRGVDGGFYGTTSAGGTDGVGTLFRIDQYNPVEPFMSLYSFEATSIHTPYTALVAGGDGKLYGAAHDGGSCCGGTYIFDPPAPMGTGGGFTFHAEFDHFTTGSSPWGMLGVGASPRRHLYGTQAGGGVGNQGTLFGLLDIEVANRPPVPVALASPNPAEAQSVNGATISLNALGSWDADFDDLTYSWALPSEATTVGATDAPTLEATFPVTAPGAPWSVTLNVSDGEATRSVTVPIAVIDAPPILSSVDPVAAVAPTSDGTAVFYPLPTATDAVDGDLAVTCAPPPGSMFELGPTPVACSATDSRGNTAETSFVVTVTLDTTPPILSLPDGVIAEATSLLDTVVTYIASASDNLGIPSVKCMPDSGSKFPLGATTVLCTATDSTSLTAEGSFTVNVVDTTGPAIAVPENIVVVTSGGVAVPYEVTAFDRVDGDRPVTCTPPSGSTFPANVTTTVVCRSSDERGNSTPASFTVTVTSAPPTLEVTLSPGVLWPPNHKMVTITATIAATSPDESTPIVKLVSITSNEPDNGLGDGDTAHDIQDADYGTDDCVFQLRSERSGKGKGRVYTVTYRAEHPLNPAIFTITQATVTVPHDMKGKSK